MRVPDQVLATVYYVQGLGLTRDPYLMVDTENMWVNVGQEQFHLPTGGPPSFPQDANNLGPLSPLPVQTARE